MLEKKFAGSIAARFRSGGRIRFQGFPCAIMKNPVKFLSKVLLGHILLAAMQPKLSNT